MQCLILAGGLGTRMRSVAPDMPKTLVEVNGRPFADYQLRWLHREGVTRVVYAIGHKGRAVREFVGDGQDWGLDVTYSDEGEARLGTAGAVRMAVDAGKLDDAFFVLYGDSYLRIDLRAMWAASGDGAAPTMAVFRNDGQWDASNAVVADGVVKRYEKGCANARDLGMDHIDYGVSVLNSDVVRRHVAAGQAADLAALYHDLSVSGELSAFEAENRFYEVGSPQGLADLAAFLKSQEGTG